MTGGQLRCGGRLYLKGLGVHSAARLSYKLDRPWSRFQAEVGIDDSTAGRGSVGFRIFVDGKLKYASPAVRGGMPPQAVSVDLAGAKQLDLVVDYGEGGRRAGPRRLAERETGQIKPLDYHKRLIAWVLIKNAIVAYDRHLFDPRLRGQEPIEWIPMNLRQRRLHIHIFHRNRQHR